MQMSLDRKRSYLGQGETFGAEKFSNEVNGDWESKAKAVNDQEPVPDEFHFEDVLIVFPVKEVSG